jgi:hypothetical protein
MFLLFRPPLDNIDQSYFDHFCPIDIGCEFSHLSCRFLSHLSNSSEKNVVVLRPYSTVEEARKAVLEGKAWGLLSMQSNFSEALLERMFNALETDQNTRNQSKINVREHILQTNARKPHRNQKTSFKTS